MGLRLPEQRAAVHGAEPRAQVEQADQDHGEVHLQRKVGVPAQGGFLKTISVGILTYAGMKTSCHTWYLALEIGFHAGLGQKADWNNL